MREIKFFDVNFIVNGKTIRAKIEEGISLEDNAGKFTPVRNGEKRTLPNYRYNALKTISEGYTEPGFDSFVLSKKDLEVAQQNAKQNKLGNIISKSLKGIYNVKDVKATDNSVEMFITDGKNSKSNLRISSGKSVSPKPQVTEKTEAPSVKTQENTKFPVIKTTLNADEKDFKYNGANWRSPVDPKGSDDSVVITSHYQKSRKLAGRKARPHTGWDIRAGVGTPVKAIADGVVTVAAKDGIKGYGSAIFIEHIDSSGKKVVSEYGHLSGLNVKVGQKVKQGEIIGKSGGLKGAPGAGISQAPHLHLTIREQDINGKRLPVAPNKYIKT